MREKIKVYSENNLIGTLALTKNNQVAFQYSEDWLNHGFSLNPFKLPLTNQVYIAKSPYFKGLFGVFADSLPDSFGELLLDRYLQENGVDVKNISCLDRLAYIGSSGMGFMRYVPDLSQNKRKIELDFDVLQKSCNDLLACKENPHLEELYYLGGSSGGARPKALITYNNEDYIVKFQASFDPKNITEKEFQYMSLAKKAGINIPEIKLVTSKNGKKYFLIKRFDRVNKRRIHVISVAALLECDFRAQSLDYNDLIKLTNVLTKNEDDVYEMYRRMVFNCLIDNQDDHAKNFSFYYNEDERMYRLAPAYDILPINTYYGEHTTSMCGKGKDFTRKDFLEVAKRNHLSIEKAETIIRGCETVLNIKIA